MILMALCSLINVYLYFFVRPNIMHEPFGSDAACQEGMTLQPGESCTVTIIIPTRTLGRRDDL